MVVRFKNPVLYGMLSLFVVVFGASSFLLLHQLPPSIGDLGTIQARKHVIIQAEEARTIQAEKARIIQAEKDHTIQAKEHQTMAGLNAPAPEKRGPQRLYCLVTSRARRAAHWRVHADTWGAQCDGLYFFHSDPPGRAAPAGAEGLRIVRLETARDAETLWEQVWRTVLWANRKLDEANAWFIFVDDLNHIGFPVMNNIQWLLQFYDSTKPYFFGHTQMDQWEEKNIVYNSPSVFILSKRALALVSARIQIMNSTECGRPRCLTNLCADRPTSDYSLSLSLCLRSVGVNPANTLDQKFAERFVIYSPDFVQHLLRGLERGGKPGPLWIHKPRQLKSGARYASERPLAYGNLNQRFRMSNFKKYLEQTSF